ncbi:hypothetical protein TBLA_0C02980 [Henningerozyma blattae CBS 6284]|uniref:Uncharacterized protein n=1 Tax=Henningerozyma blattae (strain ATCC 34711 / CBS 6284 / DSM 70876 / NBRC 10599 / NRRL Y-10934 / UCD 77-7) TaxID=1071380 RepID=I2H150_HENB6|nr:hypothetical protein TBLA_0C02980 [Tetrapisispora blattae CBS 6284]CCH60102.1 hypothetical protein TBLA_0C02980 [Tetrapisispora blattae CBS 6284]
MDDDFHLGLEKYLKTVKAKNRSNASGDNAPSQSTLVVDENLTDSYLELKKTEKRDKYTKYDVLGRPLPKHPPKSNLPSALKKNKSLQSYSSYSQTSHVHQVGSKSNHSSNSSDLSSTSTNSSLQELPDSTNTITSNPTSAASGDSSGNGFLSSLFKRRSSIQQTSQLQQQLQSQRVPSKPGTGSSSSRPSASSASTISASTSDLNFTKVPGLQNLKPMKRILFDPSTYYNDPPQQICGKNPRKGEVEVKSDGTVIIHRLTAEQRRQLMDTSSYGIVIGGSSKLKMLNPSDDAPISNPSNSIGTLSVNDSKDYTKKRQLQIKEAEEAAEARANPSDDDQQSIMSEKASKLKIDKPMISRHSTRQSNDFPISDYSDEEDYHMHGLPDVNVSNDVLYTRCCHLREILPIPATLKQLKKHPNGPIPLLQLRNPKPSMIEIFSFSDFISIAPVLAISLDGVSLSCEMLRVILSSIIIKKDFIKITLRNTPIDADGWKILSSFIADSKSLSSIDLTMVPTIKTNVQKPSKASLKDHSIPRMKCDLSNRSSMNWDLMSAAIATRGGLNEIILSGAKMSDTEFKNFIEVACITTERIGLAYNSLTTKKYKILAKWLVKSKITGIDLGYNDLKDNLSIFSKLILDKVHNKGKSNELQFISLNATNLDIPEGSTSENNEVIKFINALCCCEKLKFLDLSNNPKLFPYGLKPIIYSLPMLTSLVRINLDYEEFSEKDALILLSALPLCTNLNAVSILGLQGTPLIGRALCDLLKRTQNLISLEVEYDKLPDDVKKEFQVITMHNVQKGVDKVNGITHGMQFKGKKLIDFHELSLLLTESFDNKEKYTKIVNHFLDKTAYARDRLLNVVRDLFLVRQRNELNSQGKAVLIRLCFIDDCLKKGISILTCRKNNLLNSSSEDIKANKTNSANPTIGSVNSSNSMLELSGETFKNEISEDHAVFLPFGKAAIENKAISAEDAVQITEDDDIFEYLSKETEKEQNILKRKENLEGELRERVSKIDPYLNKEKLRKAAESGDTERLKNLILENKVSTIVEIIDELHNQGFHLHDLFSKQKLDLDGSIYEKESSSKHSEERSRSSIKSKNNNKLNNELEEAYDSVLDEFQMKRTE